ncbi:hypothetical protein SLS61_002702 [Didymella pomorum]
MASSKKYRAKGDHYQCLFVADDEGAGQLVGDTRTPPSAQSIWKGNMYAERELWNWHQNYFDKDDCDIQYLHLVDAFKVIGLSTECEEEGGHNNDWSLGHYDEFRVDPDSGHYGGILPIIKQAYQVGATTYKSTGGYYKFIVNQHDGLLAAVDISSPRNAVKSHWKSIGGNSNVKNLQWYLAHNVINDETSRIVPRALCNKLIPKLYLWPGTLFDKKKDPTEFQALIGSPIGGTIAIMLAQHKEELGNKEIYEVTVVTDDWSSSKKTRVQEMHMFFHIRDMPEDSGDNKPTDDEAKRGSFG